MLYTKVQLDLLGYRSQHWREREATWRTCEYTAFVFLNAAGLQHVSEHLLTHLMKLHAIRPVNGEVEPASETRGRS